MADYYADSSVLVKRHVDETGAEWVRALCTPATGNVLITVRISIAEVYSALNRRLREAQLDVADYVDLAGDFDMRCTTEYQLIEVTSTVIERARTMLERYPLRAYDAVHLAAALLTQETLQAASLPPLTFLAADERLLAAARAAGLPVDTPNAHL